MTRSSTILAAVISAVICSSCIISPKATVTSSAQEINGQAQDRTIEAYRPSSNSGESFQDRTQEIVGDALKLIERNEREGASLDQHWYAFRRFGENLEQIFTAREVRFYGGPEAEILPALKDRYVSVTPIEPNQDPSEIRLFQGYRGTGSPDLIIIGQNGREVALKTVIRLVDLFGFMNQKHKRTFPEGLPSFLRRVRVYLSSTPPRQEFIAFFRQYHISDPDVVILGFERDARAVFKQAGIGEPKRYSSDSLRINWYPDADGKKVLLVSINGNRIFASRAGELVKAIFEAFRLPPRTLIFFGSAGAINFANSVGQIVAPTVVLMDDFFKSNGDSKKIPQIIRNRAAMIVPVKTVHTSVESVAVETVSWARANSQKRIVTVDQELYHVINAINASPFASAIHLYVGMFLTDDVSVGPLSRETLEKAEDLIVRTDAVRQEFLAKILADESFHLGPQQHRRRQVETTK